MSQFFSKDKNENENYAYFFPSWIKDVTPVPRPVAIAFPPRPTAIPARIALLPPAKKRV